MNRSVLLLMIAAACSAPSDDVAAGPDGDLVADTTIVAGRGDPSGAASGPSMCGIDANARISGDGVGAFRVGSGVDELLSACPRASRDEIRDVEGMMQEVVDLRREQGMVQAQIVDGRVWRVHVTDPTITTADGLRVGSTVADVIARGGVGMIGEGKLFALVDAECGMSFRMDASPGAPERREGTSDDALEALPATARVDQILAFGCEPGPRSDGAP